jgi:SAM-dependent methyltransferase
MESSTRKTPDRSPAGWEARYVSGDTPWDTGHPDRNFVETIESLNMHNLTALDVGCGTGSEAVWLAKRGFLVTGTDLSPTAIERAKARAAEHEVHVNWLVGSFPTGPARFDLIYDCGCFHTGDDAQRRSFCNSAADLLVENGLWVVVAGSKDGPDRDHGPPRISALELLSAAEPRFELRTLKSGFYDGNLPSPASAWIAVFRRRSL